MSRVSVNAETWAKIQAAKIVLREAHGVTFSSGETVSYLWTTIGKRIPDDKYQASTGFLLNKKRTNGMEIDAFVVQGIRGLSRRLGIPVMDVVATFVGAFVRVAVGDERTGALADMPVQISLDNRRLVLSRSGRSRFKPRQSVEAMEMQRFKYKEAFKERIAPHVDLDSLCDGVVSLCLHTFPLEELPYDDTPVLPAHQNPAARYSVRIMKRGRGYQVFFLSHIKDIGPTVRHPATLALVGPPVVATGATYRLFDVYRNIDWTTIQETGE